MHDPEDSLNMIDTLYKSELYSEPSLYENAVPVPRVLWHWRTELTEVPGTDMDVLHSLQKFRVRVIPRYVHGLGGGVRLKLRVPSSLWRG